MDLTTEQRSIFDAIDRKENILITGVAGTGKSFLVHEIAKRYKADLTATTGIAALNIGGTTIHAWSGIGIGNMLAEHIAGKVLYQGFMKPVRDKILSCKLLIIDEISMLSDRMFTLLDHVLRIIIHRGYGGFAGESNKPFGGLQLVLVGDFLQLPPVVKDDSNETFCFSSPSWQKANIKTHLLTHVFRQKDLSFSNCLKNVRINQLTPEDIQILSSREGVKPESVFPICIYPINSQADLLNTGQLNKINGELQIFRGEDRVDQSNVTRRSLSEQQIEFHKKKLDRDCLAPMDLMLKIGAQVMLLKNLDFKAGLVNGSMGKLIGYWDSSVDMGDDEGVIPNELEGNADRGMPIIEFFNGQRRAISLAKWESKEGDDIIVTRIQYPLRLAWAITAHKCQGMTLDAVYCDLSKTFECGQAYVSLSRAKTLEGLYVTGFHPDRIMANPKALQFYNSIDKDNK